MSGYPSPTSVSATAVMRANRKSDTKPEVRLRSALHRSGLRFRKNYRIRLDDNTIVADIVFTRARVAVFVDGCFWHACPEHGSTPGGPNAEYWRTKLEQNRQRDERQTEALEAAGWNVVRVWEHVDPHDAADRVLAAVRLGRNT